MRALGLRLTIVAACVSLALAAAAMHCGGSVQGAAPLDGSADGTTTGTGDASGSHDGANIGDDGGAGDDSSAGCIGFACDGGDERTPPVTCGSMPPTVGSPCPSEGEVCEYGKSWWLECNTQFRCEQGKWTNVTGSCSWADAGGACPATWAEAMAIDASPATCPLDCQYPEGYCECGAFCGGGGGRRVNGGMPWTCWQATPQCPSPRPLSGTPCPEAGAFCSYGGLCGCGQNLGCVDGVWQASPIPPCP